MSITITNAYGQIDVAADVVAKIIGGAALEVDGVVGMASKNQLKDGFDELLKKDNSGRGVIVRYDEDQHLFIDMYIIVSYGMRVSKIAVNVQNKVKAALEQTLGVRAAAINVFVQGVRLTRDYQPSGDELPAD
ncbi:MAG: Asp23/Gls24 family envelope stress response protein [Sporolactobacillus sp.]|jgi:uncharacterized alkaline shock family protein YloU|nr:Asp23/Gls24 family envelope stress response protein [Sporolactobacillus sp.]